MTRCFRVVDLRVSIFILFFTLLHSLCDYTVSLTPTIVDQSSLFPLVQRQQIRETPRNRRDSRTIVSGYLVNEASEDEDILQVARYMLEFVAMDKPEVLEHLMAALSAFSTGSADTEREHINWC